MTGLPFTGSGDVARDGSAPSRGVVPVADSLRNLADWLDAHPSALVDQVSFIGRAVEVFDFGTGSKGGAAERAASMGGAWTVRSGRHAFQYRQEIVPGFEFVISTSAETEASA
jgi:hypothetical protein